MLLTACDETYLLKEARTLIASAARHAPDQRFYLFLVNSNSVSDATIQSWNPNIIIERATWPHQRDRWRALMCCARSIPLQKILEEYGEPTIYLDSDTVLRGPLTDLFEALETHDLLVHFRPERVQTGAAGTPYGSTFNNGVIAIRPSAVGIRLAREYNKRLQEYITSGNPLEVFRQEYGISFVIDQELLYVTYLQLQDEVKFNPLPIRFNDTGLRPGGVIWHAKGGGARSRPLYLQEKFYYENRALFYLLFAYHSILNAGRNLKRILVGHTSDSVNPNVQ